MANAFLRYEIFEPLAPFALPSGDALGLPIASGKIATAMAESGGTPSQPSSVFTIPSPPSGARHVLVRLSSRVDTILVTFGRGANPPAPQMEAVDGPDSVPILTVREPVLMALQPGDRLVARAWNG